MAASIENRRKEIRYELSTLKWNLDSASIKRKEILVEEDKRLWQTLNPGAKPQEYALEQKRIELEEEKSKRFVEKVRDLLS